MKKHPVSQNRFPLYPEVSIEEQEIGNSKFLNIKTMLRKLGKNRAYYLWDFISSYEFVECNWENYAFQKNLVFGRFYTEVYNTIILGIPDPIIENLYGDRILYKDMNQQSESDRLKKSLFL